MLALQLQTPQPAAPVHHMHQRVVRGWQVPEALVPDSVGLLGALEQRQLLVLHRYPSQTQLPVAGSVEQVQ